MKHKITQENIDDLVKGASILTTGGGLSYKEQRASLKQFGKVRFDILTAKELPPTSYACTVAEVGPADAPPIKKGKIIKKMFDLLEKTSGKKISAIYPPEIGQESIVAESASSLKLPVVDFDPTGLRAVPYVDINIFNLKNLRSFITPIVICNDREEMFLVDGDISHKRLETILRELTTLSKTGIIFFIGGLVAIEEISKIASPSYSRALELGSIKDLDRLLNNLNPRIVIRGNVKETTEFHIKGFLEKAVTIATKETQYKLLILNEVIFLLDKKNKVLSSVPERLVLIDPVRLVGVPSGDLTTDKEVVLAVLDPEPAWKDKSAEKLFGRKRFKFLLGNI